MAIPKLFKPFHHEKSKHIYFEGSDSRHNPILIAHNEYKIASAGGGVEIEYPDVVLSLGTGLETTSSQASKDSERASLLSRLTRHGSTKARKRGKKGETSESCESGDPWDNYMNLFPVPAPTSRFVRLNPEIKEDLSTPEEARTIESIQSIVQRCYASGNQIKRLAAQLFARLFYFECTETVLETEANQVTVQGKRVFFHLTRLSCSFLLTFNFRTNAVSPPRRDCRNM
jgi:hypothetical protein